MLFHNKNNNPSTSQLLKWILGIHRHLFRYLWKPQIQCCWKTHGHSKCTEAQNHTGLKGISLKSWRQQMMDFASWHLSILQRKSLCRKALLATQSSRHSSPQRGKHSTTAESAGIFDTYLLSCGNVNCCINSSWSPRNKTAGENWETFQPLEVKASPDKRALLPGLFVRVHPLPRQQHGSPSAPDMLGVQEKTEVQCEEKGLVQISTVHSTLF